MFSPLRIAYWVYRSLPLSLSQKAALRNVLFKTFPWIFAGTAAYRHWQGNLPAAERLKRRKAPLPETPAPESWRTLPRQSGTDLAGGAYVVIPVYAGRDETLACLHSVLRARAATPCEVVVILDAGPDQQLNEELRRLAGQGLFTLLENDVNTGFVATANRGMALRSDRDVVLLNSDTIVYGDWLARLTRAAHRDGRTGTVTPLSNNAEICSYPAWVQNNDYRLEVDFDDLDRLASQANPGVVCEVPTAVGFCMYIRRDCLNEVGGFDEERFGKGYGEENDFSLRAARAGWRNVLAFDVFVRHFGGVSFSDSKQRRMDAALKTITQLYPSYVTDIAAFIEREPVRPCFARLDAARLRHAAGIAGRRTFAFVTHSVGGGTEKHVRDLGAALTAAGLGVVVLRSHPADPPHVTIECLSQNDIPDLHLPTISKLHMQSDFDVIVDVLRLLGVEHLHVHQLVGYGATGPDWALRLARELRLNYDVTLHDYACICPRIHLVNGRNRYCGVPDVAECERCVRKSGSYFGNVEVRSWRRQWQDLLSNARRVFVPSGDVARRVAPFLPGLAIQVRPHADPLLESLGACGLRPRGPDERLRVAMIGAIARQKGFGLLMDCVKDARKRKLPIDWVVVGYTCEDGRAADAGVRITGAYTEDEIGRVLAEERCHVALFASISPETFSYTLSIALKAGLFPVAFDLGAVADRIREAGWGRLLPVEWVMDAKAVNDTLLSLTWDKPPEAARTMRSDYGDVLADYYGLTAETVDAAR